jgi:tight adherence protein C
MNSGLMLFIGMVVAVVFGYYFLNHMNDLLTDRATECTSELPEIVSTMALLINAGMMLSSAWRTIADSKEGTVYDLMKQSCSEMDNGMSEVDAIHRFGRLSDSAEVRKFTSALTQSIERGGAELNNFLARQSVEIWTLKKQLMLQKGEAASSKLLAPTAMLFIGIIIAVITGALGMLI